MSGTKADSSIDPMPKIGSLWRVPAGARDGAAPGTVLQLVEVKYPYASDEEMRYTISCRFAVLFGVVPEYWLRDGCIHMSIGRTEYARSLLDFSLEEITNE